MIKVILNADDFGFSKGINRGIIDSIKHGIITSTSIMVNRQASHEASVLKKYKNISIGLHLDLTEENPFLRWGKILYILTWSQKRIKKEFDSQIDSFIYLIGKKPDHIDSHHHIHWITGFKKVVLEYSNKNNIPVRCKDAKFNISFYGRSIYNWNDINSVSSSKLINILKHLNTGVHEIMCHPGYVDNNLKETGTMYLYQRESEVRSLTSKAVKSFLSKNKNIELASWKNIG